MTHDEMVENRKLWMRLNDAEQLLREHGNVTCPARFSSGQSTGQYVPPAYSDCGTCLTCRTQKYFATSPPDPSAPVDDGFPMEFARIVSAIIATPPVATVDSQLAALAVRVAALEEASDVSQIGEDNLASLCKGLDERVAALEECRGALRDVPDGIQHEYVNDGKKRCEVCGVGQYAECNAVPGAAK